MAILLPSCISCTSMGTSREPSPSLPVVPYGPVEWIHSHSSKQTYRFNTGMYLWHNWAHPHCNKREQTLMKLIVQRNLYTMCLGFLDWRHFQFWDSMICSFSNSIEDRRLSFNPFWSFKCKNFLIYVSQTSSQNNLPLYGISQSLALYTIWWLVKTIVSETHMSLFTISLNLMN